MLEEPKDTVEKALERTLELVGEKIRIVVIKRRYRKREEVISTIPLLAKILNVGCPARDHGSWYCCVT